LYKQGLAIHQIAKEMSRSWWAVKAVLGATLPTEERLYSPGPTRLSMVEREEIRAGLARGETFTAIAARLGRATSSISERSEEERRTGALPGLEALIGVPPALLAGQRWQSRWPGRGCGQRCRGGFKELWSPEQLARRLRLEYPSDPMMWVTHETISQSLFLQRLGPSKWELVKCLRTGRVERLYVDAQVSSNMGRSPTKVMISERPGEVTDQVVQDTSRATSSWAPGTTRRLARW